MSAALALGRLVRAFFTEHLLQQKQVSPQTVAAYRDTVRLLLTFLQQHRHIPPDQVTLDDLDVPVILAFLDYLETDRHNSSRSRNARLAALRSFFRFVAFRCPDRLEVTTRVLAIPRKKTTRRVVHFLTRAEMEALLTTCNLDTWEGPPRSRAPAPAVQHRRPRLRAGRIAALPGAVWPQHGRAAGGQGPERTRGAPLEANGPRAAGLV